MQVPRACEWPSLTRPEHSILPFHSPTPLCSHSPSSILSLSLSLSPSRSPPKRLSHTTRRLMSLQRRRPCKPLGRGASNLPRGDAIPTVSVSVSVPVSCRSVVVVYEAAHSCPRCLSPPSLPPTHSPPLISVRFRQKSLSLFARLSLPPAPSPSLAPHIRLICLIPPPPPPPPPRSPCTSALLSSPLWLPVPLLCPTTAPQQRPPAPSAPRKSPSPPSPLSALTLPQRPSTPRPLTRLRIRLLRPSMTTQRRTIAPRSGRRRERERARASTILPPTLLRATIPRLRKVTLLLLATPLPPLIPATLPLLAATPLRAFIRATPPLPADMADTPLPIMVDRLLLLPGTTPPSQYTPATQSSLPTRHQVPCIPR